MQDRLKFRVYHKPTNKIYNVYGFNDDFVFIDTFDTCEPFFREDCILLQCLGLKDKNGKLIYEGDLIKEPANKYPLEIYYDKGAWLTREYRKNGNNEQLLYVLINCYGVEVIGNIHENPDLLENKDESI